MRRAPLLATSLLALTLGGCKESHNVGDHVLVEWEGKEYPAMILESSGPTKYKVHYDGYDAAWDEVVPKERVKGFVTGEVVHPEPPAKVRAKAAAAAKTNVHKVGDRVRVEWHGQLYPAVILEIVGHEQYRIHYEGYGTEWDETVGLARIQPK
jgi:hypothetical protein